MVYHKNPLYSAHFASRRFYFAVVHLCDLGGAFIAAVQILIYAGAIMVLVVFVIMLLNLDDDTGPNTPAISIRPRWRFRGRALAQTLFVFYAVMRAPNQAVDQIHRQAKL